MWRHTNSYYLRSTKNKAALDLQNLMQKAPKLRNLSLKSIYVNNVDSVTITDLLQLDLKCPGLSVESI